MSTGKKIVIINQDSGYLVIDIANAFSSKGYNVTIIAGRIVVRNTPLSDKVSVRKIVKYNNKTGFHRISTWIMAFFQIVLILKIKFSDSPLLIFSNPPFAPLLPFFVRNKYALTIFDIYPDAITELGILKSNSIIIKIWARANLKIYPKAERIITLTEGMKNSLLKYSCVNQIEIIPVWSDNLFLKPIPKKNNPFIKRYNLSGKFVVLYSGNIGLAQNIETLVESARLIEIPNIIFLIIGDGRNKYKIDDLINKYNLQNCIMLPWQESDQIPFSFASADLAVVSIAKMSSKLAIPSKFYNFLSVGSPILGIAPNGSELSNIINKKKIGKCFTPDEVGEISNFVETMFRNADLRAEFHKNSINFSESFTSDNAYKYLPIEK